jgi:hypothetical protein
MLLIRFNPPHVQSCKFGEPLHAHALVRDYDLVIVFTKEIDRSFMNAEFFFKYIFHLWFSVLRDGTPDHIIVIDNARLW